MLRWFRQIPGSAPLSGTPSPALPQPTEEELASLQRFLASPDRKARREAAVRLLDVRLTEILSPMGFAREGKSWVLSLPAGKATVAVQRFSGGINATLTIGFQPERGLRLTPVRPDHVQLPNFVQPGEGSGFNRGTIHYAVVDADPATLDFPLAVLQHRALPWLMDRGAGRPVDRKDYRSRPLPGAETSEQA